MIAGLQKIAGVLSFASTLDTAYGITGPSKDVQIWVQVGGACDHAKDTAYLPDKRQAGAVLLSICLTLC